MAKYLVIVESPGKIKAISSYLGKDYQVMASIGHIRVLDRTGKHNFGVDVDNSFKPTYKNDPEKKDVIKKLKEAAKNAEIIYLASDNDLEGESISWHLREVLGVPKTKIKRITFNEITKKSIQEAIANPRDINQEKVNAQETRRILDRIVGFRLSGLALSKLNGKSAGRVQSSALKILVDRELEIKNFIPETYFEIYLPFVKSSKNYKAKYKGTDLKKMVSIGTQAEVDKIVKESVAGNFSVGNISTKNRKVKSKAPYTTSSFQQEASAKLDYKPKKSMGVAQKLYEGYSIEGQHYGLITYMRTDSERLSDDFVVELKKKIEKDYGKNYYSGSINFSKKSETANVQDAHEGIRPTHLELTPEKVAHVLSNEELRVYTLIYNRTVASLMVDADVKDTEVMIYNGKHRYGITGHELVFDGFMKVYSEFSEEQSDDSSVILPSFKVGEKIADKTLIIEKKQTNPPARYTEAKLIKELEKLGIGRPSTYASIMDTLTKRDYTMQENKSLIPTQKGIEVIGMLVQYFSTIINSTYTAQMETKLDEISEGKAEKLAELDKFYKEFEPLVLKAFREFENGREKPVMTDKLCPKCNANMLIRTGKFGQFYACSKYPKCKTTEPFIDPNKPPVEKAPVETTNHSCPVCNKGKIVKRISKSGKNAGSVFYACNAFPKCKTTFNEQEFAAKFTNQEFTDISTDQED